MVILSSIKSILWEAQSSLEYCSWFQLKRTLLVNTWSTWDNQSSVSWLPMHLHILLWIVSIWYKYPIGVQSWIHVVYWLWLFQSLPTERPILCWLAKQVPPCLRHLCARSTAQCNSKLILRLERYTRQEETFDITYVKTEGIPFPSEIGLSSRI